MSSKSSFLWFSCSQLLFPPEALCIPFLEPGPADSEIPAVLSHPLQLFATGFQMLEMSTLNNSDAIHPCHKSPQIKLPAGNEYRKLLKNKYKNKTKSWTKGDVAAISRLTSIVGVEDGHFPSSCLGSAVRTFEICLLLLAFPGPFDGPTEASVGNGELYLDVDCPQMSAAVCKEWGWDGLFLRNNSCFYGLDSFRAWLLSLTVLFWHTCECQGKGKVSVARQEYRMRSVTKKADCGECLHAMEMTNACKTVGLQMTSKDIYLRIGWAEWSQEGNGADFWDGSDCGRDTEFMLWQSQLKIYWYRVELYNYWF